MIFSLTFKCTRFVFSKSQVQIKKKTKKNQIQDLIFILGHQKTAKMDYQWETGTKKGGRNLLPVGVMVCF